MINLVVGTSNDARFNLATEEYLVYKKKFKDPLFFLWQNANTIVVGRNQNAFNEINVLKAQEDNVTIIRRNTGGGTVYQDMGNICFSSIVENNNLSSSQNYQRTLAPIIDFLNQKGVKAYFSGRNDIEVDQMKISGNAQLKTQDKILEHGTLLFDVDLSKLPKYLNVDKTKMESKKVASVGAKVTNIKHLLNEPLEIEEFTKQLITHYVKGDEVNLIELNDEDIMHIKHLVSEKYSNWDWTFGKNAEFKKKNKVYEPHLGLIEVNFDVVDARITKVKFYGDFMGYQGTEKLERALVKCLFTEHDIQKVLNKFKVKNIFGPNFKEQDIIDLFFK
ncbi:lipoate--protein ligase [[Acholeplasma] multilocale]|uniref:lipoate--protein ligase n=1 Tax=[Acholeplasma] multilocale TaxID=264638 RepID=UPI000479EFE9|nr:lipoate--protein ligase [[Acholeplasma] multilocale]